ncbi:MAG: BamA/TamA family outer membrane protein, partial [Cyclobacteriaceae bacterium]|nr:BamA/TamA family outer membrane protein [Cyclobacteriaceae bacterium]
IFYPELERKSENEFHHFLVGGGYQSVNIKSNLNNMNSEQDRFIITYANSLEYQLLDVQRHYLALYGSYTFDKTNSQYFPLDGLKWNIFIIGLEDIDDKELDVNYQRIRSDISYYYTFGRFLKTTLALRAGGSYTNGEFEFYHAAKSGGSNTFRGVRKFRFYGQHSFYQNTDLRIKLFNIRNPLIPITFGLVLFHDFGRVWVKDDSSTKMHRAYGGGIWIAPLNKISFGLDYSRSTLDEDAVYLRLGFFF